MVLAYEAKIEKLEKQKLLLADQAAQAVPPKGRFDDFIEHTMTFLASPWSIYENGGIALRRTVLKLAFAEPLSYNRKTGYRAAKTNFPFKVLAGISTQKCEMVVVPVSIEPVSVGISLFWANLQGYFHNRPVNRIRATKRST